jgi:NAD(P)-dependent dehydrogenase (short-subunit alcohol dehydrogenase family)
MPDASLSGRVAVVAGATRGAGRGIAAALGEAGATVICTGRTSRTRRIPSDYDRAETIEETAELVTALGGTGVAVPVDHLVPEEVKALADRIGSDYGRIDILVNDIWGGELLKGGPAEWDTPIWQLDLEKGLRIRRSREIAPRSPVILSVGRVGVRGAKGSQNAQTVAQAMFS